MKGGEAGTKKDQLGEYYSNLGLEDNEDVDQAGDSGLKTKPKSRDVEEEELMVHSEEEPDTKTFPKLGQREGWGLPWWCSG